MPARVSILAMGAPGRKPCWPAPPEATGLRADASSRSPAHASSPGSAPRDRRAKSICAPGGGMPERRRALFVAPEAPYPLVGGGALLGSRPTYDVAVLEHFWCAPYHEQIAPHARRTILDLHNIESAWHLGCGKVEAWPQSAAHEVFYHAAIELERQWLPRYSRVL